MTVQPHQPTTNHAVCVRCSPDMVGPAICGAPVNLAPAEGVCGVCSVLSNGPCPACQAPMWDLYARIMTMDDAELVAAHLAGLDADDGPDCG